LTWKLKVRTNPGSVVTAEYECLDHGRFELTIVRDERGDPPEWVHCTWRNPDLTDDDRAHPSAVDCVNACRHVMSSPGHVKVSLCSVVQGRSAARPDERYVMNTEKLADGMPYHEWKAERAKIHRDESLRRVRKAFGRTPKAWSMPK